MTNYVAKGILYMKIAITSDSTCDLSKELVEKYDIKIIPLYINKGDESLRDGLEIIPQDIFDYVESGAGICQTAAINIADYTDLFEETLKTHDAVIHFNISSHFSSCYASARLAAEEFENVYVIDAAAFFHGPLEVLSKVAGAQVFFQFSDISGIEHSHAFSPSFMPFRRLDCVAQQP